MKPGSTENLMPYLAKERIMETSCAWYLLRQLYVRSTILSAAGVVE